MNLEVNSWNQNLKWYWRILLDPAISGQPNWSTQYQYEYDDEYQWAHWAAAAQLLNIRAFLSHILPAGSWHTMFTFIIIHYILGNVTGREAELMCF